MAPEVENLKDNHVLPSGFQLWFSIFKLKTWKPIFGRVPKVENLKEKSCPTFGLLNLVFNFGSEFSKRRKHDKSLSSPAGARKLSNDTLPAIGFNGSTSHRVKVS